MKRGSRESRFPDKHAFGPLTTQYIGRRWKGTKDRIRRWAKRVLRRVQDAD